MAIASTAKRCRFKLLILNMSEHENLYSQIRTLFADWQLITLEKLKGDAHRELNGSIFESARAKDGPRICIVICATLRHEISQIARTFELADDPGIPQSWKSQSLLDLATETHKGNGLSYQDERDSNGRRTAVVLCATRP